MKQNVFAYISSVLNSPSCEQWNFIFENWMIEISNSLSWRFQRNIENTNSRANFKLKNNDAAPHKEKVKKYCRLEYTRIFTRWKLRSLQSSFCSIKQRYSLQGITVCSKSLRPFLKFRFIQVKTDVFYGTLVDILLHLCVLFLKESVPWY